MFNVLGHEVATKTLELAVRSGHMHHAYLLAGPAHIGKRTFAMQIAQVMNCLRPDDVPCGECEACTRIANGIHTDVRVFTVDSDPDEGPTTVIGRDSILELISAAHLRPYEGRTRVFIFDEADRLSQAAGNTLLKILEEPPPDVLMLLLSADAERVLPTVKSRCQSIELHPMAIDRVVKILGERGVGEEKAEVIGRLSGGCIGWAIEAAREPAVLAGVHQRLERIAGVIEETLEARFGYAEDLARRFQRDRVAGREELYLWLRWFRDILLIQHRRADAVVNVSWSDTLIRQADALTPAQVVLWLRLVTESIELLERNANARLTLDVLMLEAPRLSKT